MRYLLDTNCLLWSIGDTSRLSRLAREIIEGDNDILFSDASLWEIAIKNSIGKLEINGTILDIEKECLEQDFDKLSIKSRHFEFLRNLPIYHHDPFDRLIVAQAMSENLCIISSDSEVAKYPVDVFWK
ncbi:MAG: type II toxin-antitoxin system VapC family toxin [Lachnospiraceae bacterium]|nr:type II toxin-antitoxin system VapC family toxin [Lachnospiraceae bacterium]